MDEEYFIKQDIKQSIVQGNLKKQKEMIIKMH